MDITIILDNFFAELSGSLWLLFKTWWWLLLPIFFYFPAKKLYLWWIQWEVWYKELNWLMLELTPPSNVDKPFLAMEDVFTAMWPIYDGPNWREQWCEGEFPNGPFWYSFEIASIEGEIHFYARIPKDARSMFESIIHSNYPDVEIIEANDYVNLVPHNMPNEEWDFYGEDYVFSRPENEPYPIKTFKFFEISPSEIDPTKKLDPFIDVLERLAKLKKGEHFWFQMVMTPIYDEVPWVKDGQALVEKLTFRSKGESKSKTSSIAKETFNFWVHNDMPFAATEEKKEESVIPLEMKLTPGERNTVAAVEDKISKLGFKTSMRCMYIYKKEAYDGAFKKIIRGYLTHFTDLSLNSIRFWSKTRPKIHYFFRNRRMYNRKKQIFEKYLKRFPPKYPNLFKGTMVLNAEELATIFHFPMTTAGLPPSIPSIQSKKSGPPSALPTE